MNIVATGGGGFTHQSDDLLENYVLSLSDKKHPNIGFLPTASGDNETKIACFHERFKHSGNSTHLGLFGTVSDVAQWIHAQDIIYVGGGNTKSMLAVWQSWNLPELLRNALHRGTTLAGVSAGAVCWFDVALSDSAGSGLQPLSCLGLLSGSCCPHFCNKADPAHAKTNNKDRKTVFKDLISEGKLPAGIGIDDGVAVHYSNGELVKVISARDGAAAYKIEANGKELVTKTLPA